MICKNKKFITSFFITVFVFAGIFGLVSSIKYKVLSLKADGIFSNQKTAEAAALGGLRLTQEPGLSPWYNYSINPKIKETPRGISFESLGTRSLCSIGLAPLSCNKHIVNKNICQEIKFCNKKALVDPAGLAPATAGAKPAILLHKTTGPQKPGLNLLYHETKNLQNKNICGMQVSGAIEAPDTDSFGDLARKVLGVKTAYAIPTETTVDTPRIMEWIKNFASGLKNIANKKVFSAAMSSMLQNFSQQMAYKVAMDIASSGKGGSSLGWTEPRSMYFKNAADAALGDFIGTLGELWGADLCDPGTLGKLEITIGLANVLVSPPKPRCDWKDIEANWQAMDEGEFLNKLSFAFDPKVNYLGSSFTVLEKAALEEAQGREKALQTRGILTDIGFKDQTNIGGYIRTPASVVGKIQFTPVENDRFMNGIKTMGNYFFADILSPALDTFLTTLTGKLMERWLTKGMFNPSAYDLYTKLQITNPEGAGTTATNQQALSREYGSLMRAKFEPGGNYDILSSLASCPFPENPGPYDCVIDTNFSMAISRKMTVGEALQSGNLLKNGIFGFSGDDTEPSFQEGYPFRSMRVLRRYRIIPVGWEIAAEYINNFAEQKNYTLQKLVDCYDPNDSWDETRTKEEWCRGLVDPDWLLKTPANNCEKMAYGQEIVSEQVLGSVGNEPAKRIVARNKSCAVDKSCVWEAEDGRCLKWGYCTGEKRIWRFKGDSCEEQFNTCQTFVITPINANGKANEREYSYLKNTLAYENCDASNAGCKWYCASGEWDDGGVEWSCELQPGEKSPPTPLWERGESAMLFDRDAGICDEENEGCHKFISLNENTNLIYNGGFTFGEGDQKLEIGNSKLADGQKFNYWPVEKSLESVIKFTLADGAARIETNGIGNRIYSLTANDPAKKEKSLMPEDYFFNYSSAYTVSADVKVLEGEVKIGFIGAPQAFETCDAVNCSNWKRISAELSANESLADGIYIEAAETDASTGNTVFYVDNIFLSEYADSTRITTQNLRGYAEYGDGAVYLKKAPEYLWCGLEGSRTPSERSTGLECSKYALECNKDLAGCSKYAPTNGDPWIPGIVSEEDKCDIECVNYKSYNQNATNFSKEISDVRFIADSPYAAAGDSPLFGGTVPVTGKVCPAEAVGCAEFTNLDELEKGGEAREYYTFLRQCVKTDADGNPLEDGGECASFYTWTGSDTEGYQLKTYYLKENPPNPLWERGKPNEPGAPYQISNPQDFGSCAGPEDMKNNPEHCKEFYNEGGQTFYAIIDNTVSCSENCHPYRKTRENISQSLCAVYGSAWIAAGTAVEVPGTLGVPGTMLTDSVCKLEIENCLYSNGKWINNECVYMADPDEGIKCQSQDAGCNLYKGTTSANVRILMKNDFEDKTNMGWTNGTPSSDAAIVGTQSLAATAGVVINKNLTEAGTNLNKAKIYEVSFLGRATQSGEGVIVVLKGTDFYAERVVVLNSTDWREYKTNMIVLGGDLDENGIINSADIAILDRAISNPMSVTARQRELADIDGDGNIDGVAGDAGRAAGTDGKLLQDFISAISAGALSAQTIEIKDINSNIYFDNIVLKETQGDLYLIKDSWQVPDQCHWPESQLGCAEYNDHYGNLLQLKSFERLCPSWAIGCERMIDTFNSESLFGEEWDITTPDPTRFAQGQIPPIPPLEKGGNIVVPRDRVVYFVNNPEKYCKAEDKGCQRFGVPKFNQIKTALEKYSGDVFFLNDPDQYGTILCSEEALECSEYTTKTGDFAYFKDPMDKVCEYSGGQWIKRVDSSLNTPLAPLKGGLCPTTENIHLTIGASPGLKVSVPADDWVGLCPGDQSGCAEYVDPLSNNAMNLVFNGDFEQDTGLAASDGTAPSGPDGWNAVTGYGTGCQECLNSGYANSKTVKSGEQKIALSKNTLYTLSARVVGTGNITIDDCLVGSFDGTGEETLVGAGGGTNEFKLNFEKLSQMEIKSARFYVYAIPPVVDEQGNVGCKLTVNAVNAEAGFVDNVSVQETGVYYNIAESLEKCATFNPSAGCALLYERIYTNIGYGEPIYNIDNAYNGANISCAGSPSCSPNANALIKVEPDRVCGAWLYELTKAQVEEYDPSQKKIAKKDVVFAVGECGAFDENGNCSRPILREKKNLSFSGASISLMKDISGLSKAGFSWPSEGEIEGYYPLSQMTQFGQYIKFNGSFEETVLGNQPASWREATNEIWDAAYFETVNNPVAAQRENLPPIAPEGKNFLKLNKDYIAVTENLPVFGGTEYIITAFVNTRNIGAKDASAKITALVYAQTGQADREIELFSVAQGSNWTFLSKKIVFDADGRNIKIKLANIGQGTIGGSSYFDNITINPALEIAVPIAQSGGNQGEVGLAASLKNGVSPSICKVYPQEDSFACEYIADNGINYKGEKGYCLEYDRAPGDSNNCISWFPVDVIRGEEGNPVAKTAYGKFGYGPLYYCAEAEFLESRRTTFLEWVDNDTRRVKGAFRCPLDGYCETYYSNEKGEDWYWCQPDETAITGKHLEWPHWNCAGGRPLIAGDWWPENWFWYTGKLDNISGGWYHQSFADLDPNHNKYQELFQARCTKIVQVSNAAGESVPWQDRLNFESDYAVAAIWDGDTGGAGALLGYRSDSAPYGAVTPPASLKYNPEEWDGNSDPADSKQPLFFISPKWQWDSLSNEYKFVDSMLQNYNQPRAGIPYSCSNLLYPDAGCVAPWGGENDPLTHTQINIKNNVSLAKEELKRLFAKSYGAWQWNNQNNKYEKITEGGDFSWKDSAGAVQNAMALWNPPTEECSNSERGENYCAIKPEIERIKIAGKEDGDIRIGAAGSALLEFNSKLDENQGPLTGYNINWGDGTRSIGDKLRIESQPHENNPHRFSHSYSYYDLVDKYNSNYPGINRDMLVCLGEKSSPCSAYSAGACCYVKPRIRIKDNWDWCNSGGTDDICSDVEERWAEFSGQVIFTER